MNLLVSGMWLLHQYTNCCCHATTSLPFDMLPLPVRCCPAVQALPAVHLRMALRAVIAGGQRGRPHRSVHFRTLALQELSLGLMRTSSRLLALQGVNELSLSLQQRELWGSDR